MRLYHFTSKYHVKGVQKRGLSAGVIVTETFHGHPDGFDMPGLSSKPVMFVRGYQWLTKNPRWNQSWNRYSRLPYDRCGKRVTVDIPLDKEENVLEWVKVGQSLSTLYEVLNEVGDCESWVLYKGIVLPGWIVAIEDRR